MSGGDSVARPFPQRRHLAAATAAFALFAVYGSLVPWDYAPTSFGEAFAQFRALPFLELRITSRTDWAANLLLFLPIGYCGMAMAVLDRRPRWFRDAAFAIGVWLGCVVLSLAVEFAQYWFAARVPSAYDIQAQAIGDAVGIALAWLTANRLVGWLRRATSARASASRWEWLLRVYVVGLIVYQVLPLDITIHPREIWEKYKIGRIEVVPFSHWHVGAESLFAAVLDIVIHIPLGAWCVLRSPRDGAMAERWTRAFLVGTAVAAACEVAQLVVFSRFASSTDVIIAALGVAIGAGVAAWTTGRETALTDQAGASSTSKPHLAIVLGMILYAGFLMASYWRPFELLTDTQRIGLRLRNFFGLPFDKLFWGNEFNLMTQVMGKFIAFLPLGLLAAAAMRHWATTPRRRHAATALTVAGAALLGAFVEIVQAWFPPHYPDCTDAIIYTLGSLGGVMAGRYLFAGESKPPAP